MKQNISLHRASSEKKGAMLGQFYNELEVIGLGSSIVHPSSVVSNKEFCYEIIAPSPTRNTKKKSKSIGKKNALNFKFQN